MLAAVPDGRNGLWQAPRVHVCLYAPAPQPWHEPGKLDQTWLLHTVGDKHINKLGRDYLFVLKNMMSF